MPLDTNIIMGYQAPQIESPVNQLAKVLQIQGAQQANRFNQQKMDEYQRGLDEQNRLSALLQDSNLDLSKPEQRQRLYAAAPSKAAGFIKSYDDGNESKSKIALQNSQVAENNAKAAAAVLKSQKDYATRVFAAPSIESAMAAIDQMEAFSNSVGMKIDLSAERERVSKMTDPMQIKQWAAGHALEAEKLLPEIKSFNAGGNQVTQAVDRITGLPTETGRTEITQSADNKANNQRIAAEGAANRAVQIRGQNMTDARAAASAEQKTAPKPLPAAALKMQQEGLDAIGTASGINADLGAIEQQIAGGKLSFGPVANAVSGARNALGMSNEESRNLASFRSNLEKLRNDSLRLNKGVQTDGDAQRAWNELFQNINDTELVKQRLGEIKRINDRAVQLRKMDIDGVRANYGHDPLDVTGYTKQPSTLNGGKSGASNIDALLEKYK